MLLEDAFQACQYDHALAAIVVVNDSEFDFAITFFLDSRLCMELSAGFSTNNLRSPATHLLWEGNNVEWLLILLGRDGMRLLDTLLEDWVI